MPVYLLDSDKYPPTCTRSGTFEALAILSSMVLRVKKNAQIKPKYSAKSHLTRVAGPLAGL